MLVTIPAVRKNLSYYHPSSSGKTWAQVRGANTVVSGFGNSVGGLGAKASGTYNPAVFYNIDRGCIVYDLRSYVASGLTLKNVQASMYVTAVTIQEVSSPQSFDLVPYLPQFVLAGGAVTYVNFSQFTMVGNYTASFPAGSLILVSSATYSLLYGTISGSSYSGGTGLTTISCSLFSGAFDATINNSICYVGIGCGTILSDYYLTNYDISLADKISSFSISSSDYHTTKSFPSNISSLFQEALGTVISFISPNQLVLDTSPAINTVDALIIQSTSSGYAHIGNSSIVGNTLTVSTMSFGVIDSSCIGKLLIRNKQGNANPLFMGLLSDYDFANTDIGTTFNGTIAAVGFTSTDDITADLSILSPDLYAVGGSGQIVVSCAGNPQADSYDLYWQSNGSVFHHIQNVSFPYTHTGLQNGQTVNYYATCTSNTYGTSENSLTVQATTNYQITASTDGHGTISPSGTVVVPTSQAFTFTPYNGFVQSVVYVDGVSVGKVKNYTFSNLTANHVIKSTFEIPMPISFFWKWFGQ